MIPAYRLTTEPVVVCFAGCEWPLLFDLWAVRKLGQRVAPDDTGLEWLKPLMTRMANGDIDALAACLWAGMLRENPGLTFDQTLGLLDEASMSDLVALPVRVLGALEESFGQPGDQDDEGQGGWDWETALAFWFDKGRPEAEFWQTTFRTFTSLSNGFSRLYQTAAEESKTQASSGNGWTLEELLAMGRTRR